MGAIAGMMVVIPSTKKGGYEAVGFNLGNDRLLGICISLYFGDCHSNGEKLYDASVREWETTHITSDVLFSC